MYKNIFSLVTGICTERRRSTMAASLCPYTAYHWEALPTLFVKKHQSAYIDNPVYFNKRG